MDHLSRRTLLLSSVTGPLAIPVAAWAGTYRRELTGTTDLGAVSTYQARFSGQRQENP